MQCLLSAMDAHAPVPRAVAILEAVDWGKENLGMPI